MCINYSIFFNFETFVVIYNDDDTVCIEKRVKKKNKKEKGRLKKRICFDKLCNVYIVYRVL